MAEHVARIVQLGLIALLAACASTPATHSTPVSTQSTAVLENTYWKLLRVGDLQVVLAETQREPHFILQPQMKRVTGFGGCNGMNGSYTLEGEKLSFGPLAATRMACAQGMDVEQAFHVALGRVARWRIDGERLELFDAAGASVAQFESRYMQ